MTFSWRRKDCSDDDEMTASGRPFQTWAAATGKAQLVTLNLTTTFSVTNHFSGPGTATGQVCVCLTVCSDNNSWNKMNNKLDRQTDRRRQHISR